MDYTSKKSFANKENMPKPNFLIVGASKSGTTSLAKYLNLHPQIFVPEKKEPRFLVSEAIKKVSKKDPSYGYLRKYSIFDLKSYLNLFEGRTEKAIGEGSVHYLYHYSTAIPNIVRHLGPETKIIILLRNPVDRAISNWKYQDKDFLDFKSALDKEEDRMNSNYNSFWYYKKSGFYYEQVKSYLENFKNVKIILFEDFVTKTDAVIRETFEFLDVQPDYKIESFKQYNKSTITVVPKGNFFKFLFRSQKGVNLFKKLVKLALIPKRFWADKKNMIDTQDKLFLKSSYLDDIEKLQVLLNRELSNWI